MVASQAPPVYGGAGTQALGLARELCKRGVAVDLFTQNQLQAPLVEDVEGVRVLRAPGESLFLRLPQRAAEIARTMSFLFWLFFRLLTGGYDVLHLHGSYWFGVPATAVGLLRGTPTIVKVTRLGEDDAKTVANKRIGPVPLGAVYGWAFSRAGTAIALSGEIERRHREVYPDTPVRFQPNGVDVERFQKGLGERLARRRDLGIDPGTFVVLFVGYLAPHKGVDTLLEGWQQFAPGRNATLLLVGPSGGFYRELKSDVSQRAKGTASVVMVEHAEFKDMPSIYGAADVMILPTKAEGMPNSFLEALASGLPTIVSDVPGVMEVSSHATGVVTLAEVTADRIAQAFQEVETSYDPDDRAPRLPDEFALENVAAVYDDLYLHLVNDDSHP